MPYRGLSRQYHIYKDWVYGAAILLSAVAILIGLQLHNHKPVYVEPKETATSKVYSPDENELYKIVPPDPQYPAPAKTQLAFYKTYTPIKELSFSLEWTQRNLHRDTSIGDHVFTLNIVNNLNSVQNVSGDALHHISVGCVAYDGPYRIVPASAFAPFTLEPYEKKQFVFKINVSCLYLGTPDGQYFWRIY